jgi:hypothetical protein
MTLPGGDHGQRRSATCASSKVSTAEPTWQSMKCPHYGGMDMGYARLWWALAAAITLQLFILYYQLNYGALVGLIPWDDCAVVLGSLENLDKLAQAHSLWHMLGAALHLHMHAPVSAIQTTVTSISSATPNGPLAFSLFR